MYQRLIELLEMLSLKQKDFANEVGVTPSNVNDWLKGRSKPGSDALLAIYNKFNVNLNWLVSGQGEMFNKTYNLFGQRNKIG